MPAESLGESKQVPRGLIVPSEVIPMVSRILGLVFINSESSVT